jgi:hypothetical protein
MATINWGPGVDLDWGSVGTVPGAGDDVSIVADYIPYTSSIPPFPFLERIPLRLKRSLHGGKS